MLAVQKFLLDGRSHEDLRSELAIHVTPSATLPLVILNYNQIDSPKAHPIVRECRGLVLHRESHELVARSFPRFFNWGEMADEMPHFDFSDFAVQSKEDGSLVLIYHFQGEWRINTRGSFAQDNMPYQAFNWESAVLQTLGVSSRVDLASGLDPELTYVGEFCSPWNKVVRRYEEPRTFLLTAFRSLKELSHDECDAAAAAAKARFLRPERHGFRALEEIQAFLSATAASDPTYEGVVIRDVNNHRWKIKSPTYLGLHRLKGDGENIFAPKNLLPFVLTGEADELLTYFPEATEAFRKCEAKVNAAYAVMQSVLDASQGIDVQKDFALAIQKKTPFTGLLFQLRKEHGPNIPREALAALWRKSSEAIVKALY
jgi:hypothetical protein